MSQPHVSLCIPTYEMSGFGQDFLRHSLNMLTTQTYKDFEVIISDHSANDLIMNLCADYSQKLHIKYFKNPHNVGSSSANINNAMKQATGQLIKVLFQDDFLYDRNSLEVIVNNFNMNKDTWLVTASEHSKDGIHCHKPHYPEYSNRVHVGDNLLGSPSILTIKNNNPLLFDENLIWLMDCDYYKRCFDKYGLPKFVNTVTVVNRVGEHQVTNTKVNAVVVKTEYAYILKKHKPKLININPMNEFIKLRQKINIYHARNRTNNTQENISA